MNKSRIRKAAPKKKKLEVLSSVRSLSSQIDNKFQIIFCSEGFYPSWTTNIKINKNSKDDLYTVVLRVPTGRLKAVIDSNLFKQIQNKEEFLNKPIQDWPKEVITLWEKGYVFFKDIKSFVSKDVGIHASRLIIKDSWVDTFSQLQGDRIIIDNSRFSSHSIIEGPIFSQNCMCQGHARLGPLVFAEYVGFGPFVKVSTNVKIERGTLIAAHSSLEGGTHRDLYPLVSNSLKKVRGIHIGEKNWIGQHVSITGGASTGSGVIVAAGTVVFESFGDFKLVAGHPARALPLDHNIRNLSPEKSKELGVLQGAEAATFPIYGDAIAEFRSNQCLELDYPDHGYLRGLVGQNILHFQKGTLTAAIKKLIPDSCFEIGLHCGSTIRFEIRFKKPIKPHFPISDTLKIMASGTRSSNSKLTEKMKLALNYLKKKRSVEQLSKYLMSQSKKPIRTTQEVEELLLHLSQRGCIHPLLLPRRASFDFPALTNAFSNPQSEKKLNPVKNLYELSSEDFSRNKKISLKSNMEEAGSTVSFLINCVYEICFIEGDMSIDEPFYELGFNSLAIAELASRIEEKFGISSPDPTEYNTIRKLSSAINSLLKPVRNQSLGSISGYSARAVDLKKKKKKKSYPQISGAMNKKPPKEFTEAFCRNISYEAWCQQNIRKILVDHFSSPKVPWIFKVIRSLSPFDHQYITWKQLQELSYGYLEMYQRYGLKSLDVISILLPTGFEGIAAYVGAILGGYLPSMVAFPSEKLSLEMFGEWFASIVEKSKTKCIICYPEIERELKKQVIRKNLKIPVTSETPLPSQASLKIDIEPNPASPLFVQHSSGTTGLKKAVQISHHGILCQAWLVSNRMKFNKQDIIVNWAPLYHDLGLVLNFMQSLIFSIPTVMISPFDWVKKPSILMEQITEEKGSVCWMPNFAFFHCANQISDQELSRFDLNSLRLVISGGEPVTAEAQEKFLKKFSPVGLQRSSFRVVYGMAEATALVSITPSDMIPKQVTISKKKYLTQGIASFVKDTDPKEDQLTLVSCGKPLPKTKIEIVNNRKIVQPEGKEGEIRLKSDSLMKGYFNDPESTKKVLKNGWYYSGDLGFFLDDELFVSGRKKDLVIVAGHNVYPHDVEQFISNHLFEIHPGRIVAFGVFEREKGTERLVILAELNHSKFKQKKIDEEIYKSVTKKIREMTLAAFSVQVSDVKLYSQRVLMKSTSGKLSREKNREMYLKALSKKRL